MFWAPLTSVHLHQQNTSCPHQNQQKNIEICMYIYIYIRMQPPNKKKWRSQWIPQLQGRCVVQNYGPQEPWKRTASPRAFDLAFDLASFLPFREKLSLKTAPTNCLEASPRHIEKNIQTCQISGSLNGALVVEVICIFYFFGGRRRQKSKYLLVTGVLFIKGFKLPTNHWLIHELRKNKLKQKKTYVWVEPSQV